MHSDKNFKFLAPCLLVLTFATLPLFCEQAFSLGGVGQTPHGLCLIINRRITPVKDLFVSFWMNKREFNICFCFLWARWRIHFLQKYQGTFVIQMKIKTELCQLIHATLIYCWWEYFLIDLIIYLKSSVSYIYIKKIWY